jgi:hypothetical protein
VGGICKGAAERERCARVRTGRFRDPDGRVEQCGNRCKGRLQAVMFRRYARKLITVASVMEIFIQVPQMCTFEFLTGLASVSTSISHGHHRWVPMWTPLMRLFTHEHLGPFDKAESRA